jgi:hypothetical protein
MMVKLIKLALVAVMATIAEWKREEFGYLPPFLWIDSDGLYQMVWGTLLEERSIMGEEALTFLDALWLGEEVWLALEDFMDQGILKLYEVVDPGDVTDFSGRRFFWVSGQSLERMASINQLAGLADLDDVNRIRTMVEAARRVRKRYFPDRIDKLEFAEPREKFTDPVESIDELSKLIKPLGEISFSDN